ncbi:MAG: hypothetical protein RXN87_02230 [Acidilobus sp.]
MDAGGGNYYIIRWDPKAQSDDDLKRMIVESMRKGAKRVMVVVKSDDISYMERAREVLANFIAQTIVVVREKEVSRT